MRLVDGDNYVSNPDGILYPVEVDRINRILKGLEDSHSMEVAVVAVHSIGYSDSREFATELFNHWGIGKKEDDNGLLILLVTEPVQRSVVFETGYGLEGILTDAVCYRLQQDYMIPAMKEEKYSEGMLKGVEGVAEYLKASDYERKSFMDASSSSSSEKTEEVISILIGVLLWGVLIGLIVYWVRSAKRRRQKCPKCTKATFHREKLEILAPATYTSTGLQKETRRCSSCGYLEEVSMVTPMLVRVGRNYYSSGRSTSYSSGRSCSYSSSSSGTSRSSSSRSSSSRSGGRSYGGGRSGGGGARSKF
ncbi:MAG: TPM domain-containing protein [Bacteroides sp.]|nr:TPM domain-containing protein [Bacteroides sp.]